MLSDGAVGEAAAGEGAAGDAAVVDGPAGAPGWTLGSGEPARALKR